MNSNNNFKLLMLYQTQNDAESIISLFRNSGHAARAKKLDSEADLHQALREQNWDLLISDNKHPELSIEQALSIINSSDNNLKVPSLLILPEHTSDTELEQAFTIGASDIIRDSNQQHLLHSALREIEHHRQRLTHQNMLEEFAEIKERYELLLENSKDAIAYITDGMHIHVNEAYAKLFGYNDIDEFDCLPIIDLIADDQQDLFKTFLKRYSSSTETEQQLSLKALKEDESEFDVCMQLSAATYEGESCTQILIRQQTGSTDTSTAANLTAANSAPQQALTSVSTAQERVNAKLIDSSTALIQLNLEEIQATAGYEVSEALLEQFSDYCEQKQLLPIRLGDYGLLFSIELAADKLQRHLDQLLSSAAEQVFEHDGRTYALSGHGGICSIAARNGDSAQTIIDHCFTAAIEAKRSDNLIAIYTPPTVEVDILDDNIDLNSFVDNGGINIHYQPIVSLRGDTGEYYEASYQLDESLEHCGARFFQGGESKLDRWIIMETSKALSAQRANRGADTRLFINLSSSALKDAELGDWLSIILKAADIPAEALVFQITEHAASDAITSTQHLFSALKKHHLRLSISHFSNGNILKHIKADFVRLADQVSEHLGDDDERQKLKELVRSLASSDVGTIVPQVNIASMLTTLWQIGVGYIQGEYLQGPDSEMNYEFADLA
ncbi:PAS domain S-box-containing protein [Sinobacterium caligoides]|uniref:PAS domain S-box-containing protein n=1 Tax=Sinobacterium caligoides TaxID=933926 RepID=A0A3N2DG52_9GAMM|nr:EAL domain-containing protein [Sinobacterium caligoides]ROR98772.1 PAS domain S-box-containing protein [Sinobacterium caligoides]